MCSKFETSFIGECCCAYVGILSPHDWDADRVSVSLHRSPSASCYACISQHFIFVSLSSHTLFLKNACGTQETDWQNTHTVRLRLRGDTQPCSQQIPTYLAKYIRHFLRPRLPLNWSQRLPSISVPSQYAYLSISFSCFEWYRPAVLKLLASADPIELLLETVNP